MEETKDLVTTSQPPAGLPVLSVGAVLARVNDIETLMKEVMKENIHYGIIPGTERKTLYKAGAEKLALLFGFSVRVELEEEKQLENGHREYRSRCSIFGPSGQFLGLNLGSCSTMESKYRYRWAELTCPSCGKNAIIKGSAEYGGGWYCWPKKGGCKARFADGDPAITNQERGKVENPDLADVYNTCLKISGKRAYLATMIMVTGAGDMFAPEDDDDGRGIGTTQGTKGSTGNGQQKKGGGKSRLAPGPLAKELNEFLLARCGGSIEDAAAEVSRLTGKASWQDLSEGEARNALAKAKAEAQAQDKNQGQDDQGGQGDIPF